MCCYVSVVRETNTVLSQSLLGVPAAVPAGLSNATMWRLSKSTRESDCRLSEQC